MDRIDFPDPFGSDGPKTDRHHRDPQYYRLHARSKMDFPDPYSSDDNAIDIFTDLPEAEAAQLSFTTRKRARSSSASSCSEVIVYKHA